MGVRIERSDSVHYPFDGTPYWSEQAWWVIRLDRNGDDEDYGPFKTWREAMDYVDGAR